MQASKQQYNPYPGPAIRDGVVVNFRPAPQDRPVELSEKDEGLARIITDFLDKALNMPSDHTLKPSARRLVQHLRVMGKLA